MKQETDFPVLNGLLTHHLERGASIAKQDGKWTLFSKKGQVLACGDKISAMLCDLILREWHNVELSGSEEKL